MSQLDIKGPPSGKFDPTQLDQEIRALTDKPFAVYKDVDGNAVIIFADSEKGDIEKDVLAKVTAVIANHKPVIAFELSGQARSGALQLAAARDAGPLIAPALDVLGMEAARYALQKSREARAMKAVVDAAEGKPAAP